MLTALIVLHEHLVCPDHHGVGSALGGILIANHVHPPQCDKFYRRIKGITSPCTIVIGHEVETMPDIMATIKPGVSYPIKFDRILCGAFNSNDAAVKVKSTVFNDWDVMNSYKYYKAGLASLKRGCEMLAVGGRVVFSTFSMNPIENEAIVHAILKEANGSLQIMDVKSMLPGLKYLPGLSKWSLPSSDLKFFSTYEEVPEDLRSTITADMFPPTANEAPRFHFERCIRILRQYQESSGFFLAMFEKVDALPWEKEKMEQPVQQPAANKIKKVGDKTTYSLYEDVVIEFIGENDKTWTSFKDFHDLKNVDSVKPYLMEQRSNKRKSTVYMVSPLIKDVIMTNMNTLKIVNAGVGCFFENQEHGTLHGCKYVFMVEGLFDIYPFLGPKRSMEVPKSDFVQIISIQDDQTVIKTQDLSAETQEKLSKIENGSFVVCLKEPTPIIIRCGKEANVVKGYLERCEKTHYLSVLGEDTSWFDQKIEEERLRDLEKSGADGKAVVKTGEKSATEQTQNGVKG